MRHVNFLYQLTKANFKLQNENSYLGILWYLLGPVLMFGILLYVFGGRLGSSIEQYPLYLLMGIINWNFFSAGTGRSMATIVRNAGLIKALPIPLPLLIVSSVCHALLSHMFELALFMGAMFYFGVTPSLIVPYCIVLMLSSMFTIGVGFLLSAGYVFIRDLGEIWAIITRAWWFATPICYALSPTGPGMYISKFNPMFYSIYLSRETLIYGRMPTLDFFLIFAAIAVGTLVIGFSVFRLLRHSFIDHL
ncbi:MAG: ABC transporter permease [Candidatus Peregrinibacteria bacterium]|nr:ABC transporter permease [Candidatus Peregrinibacteria bacterium]MCB9807754.1 ABC transporter permease [Candidatus Peribacteria bacterium]